MTVMRNVDTIVQMSSGKVSCVCGQSLLPRVRGGAREGDWGQSWVGDEHPDCLVEETV